MMKFGKSTKNTQMCCVAKLYQHRYNYAKSYILKNNTQVFNIKVYLLKLEYIINSIIKMNALLYNNNGTCTQLQLVQQ